MVRKTTASGRARKASQQRRKGAGKKQRKTTKGALIKGMTRRLPSEILASSIFRAKLKELMKGYAGIYALYRRNTLYYVGLTTNLFGRVSHHLKDRHRNRWDHFVIFRIKKVDYLRDIETLLTRIIETPGNRVKGPVPRDADINRILRQILREHQSEIQGIKHALGK